MTEFLGRSRKLSTMDQFLDHFFFNREYWYRRVRSYRKSAAVGRINIVLIKDFIRDTPTMSAVATPKLWEYLDTLEEQFENGELGESYDVCLFDWDGKDSNGLDLWLRKRGSNRSELLHQKMYVAVGPWGVGPELGHFLLLLLNYRFNVNTGIRRNGWHNFGMPWLYLIDRIQLRYLQIFGFDPFPQHVNQSLFVPIKGFVAVGIGSLNYSEDFVHTGEPYSNLNGGMLFLAQRMGLRGPPMDVDHPKERSIFNNFMRACPGKPTSGRLRTLAKLFKQKADYRTVFPKLPSMLNRHYNIWKQKQDVVMAVSSMKEPYYCLLKQLASPQSELSTAAKFQKKASNRTKKTKMSKPQQTRTEATSANQNKEMDPSKLAVPPVNAPTQTQYLSSLPVDQRGPTSRMCIAAAFGCTSLASDCARQDIKKCKQVKAGVIVLPADTDECMEIYRKQRKAILAKEKSKLTKDHEIAMKRQKENNK